MATIGEPVTLSEIKDPQYVVSVDSSALSGYVTLTLKSNVVNVFEIETQKAVNSWSFKTGQQLTSPVLWDSLHEAYITVVNNQVIKQWKKEDSSFDKATQKHYKFKIHRVLTVDQLEPIVVCENGAVDFVSSIKDRQKEGGDLTPEDRIVYCDVCRVEDSVCVVCILERKKKELLLKTDWYHNNSWEHQTQSLDVLSADEVVCCQCFSTDTDVKLYLLSKNGTFHSGRFTRTSPVVSFYATKNIDGVTDKTAAVVLDPTHIAIAGCQKDQTDVFGIFDVKFGTFQVWKSLPESRKSSVKLFCNQKHLFLAINKSLYMCSFVCQTSTVASVLGKQRKTKTDPGEIISTDISWSNDSKKNSLMETSRNAITLLTQLCDEKQTPSKESFMETFDQLLSLLSKKDCHILSESTLMMQLMDRCIDEKSILSKSAVQQLVQKQLVPTGSVSGLFDVLISHSETALLYQSLHSIKDVPEICLCKALQYFIGCDDSKLEKVAASLELKVKEDEEEHSEPPISTHKQIFINRILQKSFNDVFLLESLRSLTFKNVLILLEYLSYLLGGSQTEQDLQQQPVSMLQVVTWICLLIDAHVTQLIISPDSRLVLVSLHKIVESQAQFYSELVTLEALLLQLKEKCTIPQKKVVGEYCIEVLHVA